MTLEQRANVLIKAHKWMFNKIPFVKISAVKMYATSNVTDRAKKLEPTSVNTMVVATCQFLRTINVSIGGLDRVSVRKSGLWALMTGWLNEYKQTVGGGVTPLQKVHNVFFLLDIFMYFRVLISVTHESFIFVLHSH